MYRRSQIHAYLVNAMVVLSGQIVCTVTKCNSLVIPKQYKIQVILPWNPTRYHSSSLYCTCKDEWNEADSTGSNDAPHDKNIISYNDFDDFDVLSSLSSSSSSTFYNDFDDPAVEGNNDDFAVAPPARMITSNDEKDELSSRITSLRREEQRRVAVCDRNWKLGNWFVRGFSLETTKERLQQSDRDPIPTVSIIATSSLATNSIDDDDIDLEAGTGSTTNNKIDVWVGRTDGTIFGVRFGTDYWTRLGSTDLNDEIPVVAQLLVKGDDDDDDATPNVPAEENPSIIVTQFQSSRSSAISAIVAIPSSAIPAASIHDVENTPYVVFDIYTASKDSTDIEHFYYDGHIVSFKNTLRKTQATNDGTNSILTLCPVNAVVKDTPTTMLLSVTDSSITLWDLLTDTIIGCIKTIQIPAVPGGPEYSIRQAITCIDTDNSFIYIGTESGYVLVYNVYDMIQQKQPIAAVGCWRAAQTDDCAITAIKCGGPGTLGRNSDSTISLIIYTGDAQGMVKQWEVLKIVTSSLTSCSSDDSTVVEKHYKVETWPKLSTQRLPKRAHTFNGHYDAISGLLSVDALKFVSASTDGTVRAWNTATGKEMFRMDGFPDRIGSLCLLDSGSTDGTTDRLQNTILVTDGMDKYVCVHDFSADDEDDADYDLDMPEYIK